MATVKVSGNIDSWCTRCKLVLAHTIEAMVGGKITRVHCNTCGGQHTYRPRAPSSGTPGTRARSGKASPRASVNPATQAHRYEAMLRGRTATARPYSASARFKVGEIISHATFGLGAVTAEKDGTKIEVLFADGPRVLAQGR